MLLKLLHFGVSLLWQPNLHPTTIATYCLCYWAKLLKLSLTFLKYKMVVFCDALRVYLFNKVLRRINELRHVICRICDLHTQKSSIKGNGSKDKGQLRKWLSNASDNKQLLCPRNPNGRNVYLLYIHSRSAFSSSLFGLGCRNQMRKGTSSFEKHHIKTHTHCIPTALRLTTFRSWLVVNVAVLPSRKGSITGLPRLKYEIPLGLVK